MTTFETTAPVTIRRATAVDDSAVAGLAELDSSRIPTGDVLVARVGSEIWAAVSLDDLHAVADPFRPSGAVVELLRERARSLAGAAPARGHGLRALAA